MKFFNSNKKMDVAEISKLFDSMKERTERISKGLQELQWCLELQHSDIKNDIRQMEIDIEINRRVYDGKYNLEGIK